MLILGFIMKKIQTTILPEIRNISYYVEDDVRLSVLKDRWNTNEVRIMNRKITEDNPILEDGDMILINPHDEELIN